MQVRFFNLLVIGFILLLLSYCVLYSCRGKICMTDIMWTDTRWTYVRDTWQVLDSKFFYENLLAAYIRTAMVLLDLHA